MILQYELPKVYYNEPKRLQKLLTSLDKCKVDYSCDNITLFLTVNLDKPGDILALGILIGSIKYMPIQSIS